MQSSVLDNLLKGSTTGQPAKDFLDMVAAAHPYFAPAHFFLLQQLNQADSNFEKQAAKTSLLFNNPHWLNYQLQNGLAKETPVVTMYAVKENDYIKDETDELTEHSAGTQTEAPVQIESISADNEKAANFHETANTVEPAATVPEQIVGAMPENTDNDDDNAELVTAQTALTEPASFKLDLGAALKNAENVNAPAFEPMHLVDYFASQGIKLSDEVQGGDKLGKQLKSFTEWLKTMKKVHVANTATTGSEIAVQAMAEKSNTENEVVTEAMAEVFALQGKLDKAIEVYGKLSLLNPAKSAYFAAEIEKLKGQ